jgi:predicted dienelactone hydrolase
MTGIPDAGAPLEPQQHAVGRAVFLLVDEQRAGRVLGVDCWYPAVAGGEPKSVYEVLPGVSFTSSALDGPHAAPGAHPLVVWSHGRSGLRLSYGLLCEGLASRGYVVLSSDHPGDTLGDWLLGTATDDATNETQRVDDMRFVLDAALGVRSGLDLAAAVDAERIAVAGHSYGAFTALALAAAEPTDARVRAVAGVQSLTRTLRRSALARIKVPAMLMVGMQDRTTPPETDADRAFEAFGENVRRVDFEHAGHQACSDVGLYLELAPRVEGLPDIVSEYLQTMAADITGTPGDPWRPIVGLHLATLGDWLDQALERESAPREASPQVG